MGLSLILYLGALIIGGLIGNKMEVNKNTEKILGTAQSLCLLFLLFLMGLKIGLDRDIINSFLNLGVKAIFISIFTISFSILGIFLIRKTIFKRVEKHIES